MATLSRQARKDWDQQLLHLRAHLREEGQVLVLWQAQIQEEQGGQVLQQKEV